MKTFGKSYSAESKPLPLLPATDPTCFSQHDRFCQAGENMKELRADLPSGDFHGFVETFKGETRRTPARTITAMIPSNHAFRFVRGR